jgi:hypothetical protein
MCDRGLGLSPIQPKMKVYEITKTRWIPFRNGILGGGWMQWWKKWHPELLLWSFQALKAARASNLSEKNLRTFYDHFKHIFSLHNYLLEGIWNCNKSGA